MGHVARAPSRWPGLSWLIRELIAGYTRVSGVSGVPRPGRIRVWAGYHGFFPGGLVCGLAIGAVAALRLASLRRIALAGLASWPRHIRSTARLARRVRAGLRTAFRASPYRTGLRRTGLRRAGFARRIRLLLAVLRSAVLRSAVLVGALLVGGSLVRGLLADGLLVRGLLVRGLLADALLVRGLLADALLIRGLLVRGLLADALLIRGLLIGGGIVGGNTLC